MIGEDLVSLKSSSIPVRIATIATLCVFAVVGLLAFGTVTVDGEQIYRWQQFMRLPPNAMADTLSGIGATLTLIWVVASVFQQSLELRAQREEFRKMAEKQSEQGSTLSQISSMALHEQNLGLAKARIADLRAYFTQFSPAQGTWRINAKGRPARSADSVGASTIDIDSRAVQPSQSDELFISLIEAGLTNFLRDTRNLLDQDYEVIRYPNNREGLKNLRDRIGDIGSLLNTLPSGIGARYEVERWERVRALITKILNDERLWTDNGWEPTP